MVGPFEFLTATRILFGEGRASELPSISRSTGSRPLLLTGQNAARARQAAALLDCAPAVTCPVDGEPDVTMVSRGAALARKHQCDHVVAIGGGSVIDAAKAIAALTTNPGGVFDYLEVVGRAQPLTVDPLPIIALPTTAGTGAEVTRNAVLRSPEHQVKASLRHPLMLPRVAIVDPQLTYELSPALTASTGMDALTQLIEPFVCSRASVLVDALCREAIPRVARSLRIAFQDGANRAARSEMAYGSLCGGLALANAGLGAVHGFAAPIGGMFPVPHGAVCASLLPHVMRANYQAAMEQNLEACVRRYREVAVLLTGRGEATPEQGIAFISDLCRVLDIPALRALNLRCSDFIAVARRAAQSSSMKANPVLLSESQLVEILEQAY